MKKVHFLLVFVVAGLLASCETPSAKAEGNYSGTYTYGSSTASGTANVIKSTDNEVNVTISIPSLSVNSTANGVAVATSGDNVTFSFTGTGTADGTITALSGTLAGNSLSFSSTIVYFGFPVGYAFVGTK